MKQLFSFVGLSCALLLFNQPLALAANTNALIGTWETQVTGIGSDRGTCFLTFSNDFTWIGYGIALKSLGTVTFDGTWTVDSKDRIVGSFTEVRADGGIAGAVTKLAVSQNHLQGNAISGHGHIGFSGRALSNLSDVSGSNWVGEVRTQGNKTFQSYTFTASTNLPGWFHITGSGIGQSGSYTLSGALLVTSSRDANGFLVSDFGTGNTTSTWSFAGKFLPSLQRGLFRGRGDNGDKVVIRASQ